MTGVVAGSVDIKSASVGPRPVKVNLSNPEADVPEPLQVGRVVPCALVTALLGTRRETGTLPASELRFLRD